MGKVVSMVVCIFTNVPGSGKGWTLAVTAISEADARAYMRAWGGGRLVYTIRTRGAHVKADCGGVTTATEWAIRQNNEASNGD